MLKKRKLLRIILLVVLGITCVVGRGSASELPVKVPACEGCKEVPYRWITTFLTIDTIHSSIKSGNARGLVLDLTGIRTLLDGTVVKPTDIFFGSVYLGPYPFEADEVTYTYKRFRVKTTIQNGKAILPVGYFLKPLSNSEEWRTEGHLVVRLDLYLLSEETIRYIGLYDTFVRFKKEVEKGVKFVKQTSIIEGPMVNLLRSENPSTLVISFKTDKEVTASVVLSNGHKFYSSEPGKNQKIKITGLEPGKSYEYHVEYEDARTKSFTFRTAPKAGDGEVVFAYAGDSREGIGGGTSNFMGVNYKVLERCANLAFQLDAELFVFGGDLVTGFTTSTDDFRTQVHGWKQALAGFWRHRAVYPCIGNHEAILKYYIDDKGQSICLDRWPYETASVEAVFADEMVNPQNGPDVSDPRRPTYKENVYSFLYGPVKFIAFNNNYWVGRKIGFPESARDTGGSPEGYIMDDQLQWIHAELKSADKNPNVKYIILYGQEPVFPNGGHIQDSMWHRGNNNVRAYTYESSSGKIESEKKGIIEVRNQLLTMIAENKKVAAVLGSDEHAYHKTLIDKNVPVGVPGTDDTEGNGLLCQKGGACSSLKGLKYPTWFLVCGGAGAPYYSEGKTPWNTYWKNFSGTYPDHTSKRGCYYYSSQENFFIFKAGQDRISVTVYNPYGEVIDRIDDLMKVKE